MNTKVREAVREDARRQHRSLGMYAALFCWHHSKDATFVTKDLFLSFIGLERLKDIRFEWLEEDIKAYFPYVFRHTKSSNTSEIVVLSRIPKSEILADTKNAIYFKPAIFNLPNTYSKDSDLLGLLGDNEDKPSASKIMENHLPYLSSIENVYEFSVSTTLSSLAGGLIEPESALSKENA